ncbi:MAG: threonine/serine exporter family protein [Rhodospirillales bacterium]|nr:threonine/serine exporter family protein [Rhodospirillales bacterium]
MEAALCAIRDDRHLRGFVPLVLAAAGTGAAFCLVNGGDPRSWICSAVASGVVFGLRRWLTGWHFNIHLMFFAVALVGCFIAVLLARNLQVATPAVAVVAAVLFLVPGVPLINGGIDVVRNHLNMGMARLGFALAVLVALCLGVAATVSLISAPVGSLFSPAGAWGATLVTLAGAVAAGALALLSNAGISVLLVCALGGATGRLVRELATTAGLDVITATLIAAFGSTLLVSLIAERLHWPSVMLSVMAALPMVPGYFAIAGMNALLAFAAAPEADPAHLATGLHALSRALFISMALVVGVIGPSILLQRDKERV